MSDRFTVKSVCRVVPRIVSDVQLLMGEGSGSTNPVLEQRGC